MATQKTDTADIAARLQTFYSKKLMADLPYELVLASYGLDESYEAHGTTIRFFRPRSASRSAVGALVEATVPGVLATVPIGYVDVPLGQRGELSEKISDVVTATDLFNILQLYMRTMPKDLALDLDYVCQFALITGLLNSDASYTAAFFERFAGVTNTGDSSDDYATMYALSAANSKFTRERHLQMVTQLKDARVPMIGGNYVSLVPAATMHDIRLDTTWLASATQVNNEALYKRGKIMLDGAVFVEHDQPYREAAVYGTYDAAGAVRSNIYLGKDAFGIPTLTDRKAGSRPTKPELIVTGLTQDSGNPLKQWIQIGAKVMYGAKSLTTNVTGDVPRYGILRTKSTFA